MGERNYLVEGVSGTGKTSACDARSARAGDRSEPVTFFCGGSRNHDAFLDLFNAVVVLQVDAEALTSPPAGRGSDELGGLPPHASLGSAPRQ